LSHGLGGTTKDATALRVQWDPEITPTLERLPYRSIQISIPSDLCRTWVEVWIFEIEDVDGRATGLKAFVEELPNADLKSLIIKGVPKDVEQILGMLDQ
jgi:hypothetical protein